MKRRQCSVRVEPKQSQTVRLMQMFGVDLWVCEIQLLASKGKPSLQELYYVLYKI